MILAVNPTRMELLKLKKRVKVAKRGHKLLKEKRDGLMREFMNIIKESKSLREQIEERLSSAFKKFIIASSMMTPETIGEALMSSKKKTSLSCAYKNIMGVRVPEFSFASEGDILSYGFLGTSGELDLSLKEFSSILEDLVKLAEIEKKAELLAEEIEKTRRRVNALEYVMIPNLEETVKYINMKLSEIERMNITTVMKVKELIQE
ncbi:V-type ATP synthase subunit D [bacterium (Candidatus Torokbacteria) CG_4_10_14_0_2_um_filter_35_8]|nr:MAG: V-type ATP synthase subunit D [bacterium (Candidatus Torokbacteria) CG_4_10_14_0_2_um_filter_35_8]